MFPETSVEQLYASVFKDYNVRFYVIDKCYLKKKEEDIELNVNMKQSIAARSAFFCNFFLNSCNCI